MRDQGYYVPLIGGAKEQAAEGTGGSKSPTSNVGRPSGTGVKQSSTRQKVSASEEFSCSKLKDTVVALTQLENKIEKELKNKFKIKKLTAEQLEVVSDLAIVVAQNENLKDWCVEFKKYIENSSLSNKELNEKIDDVAARFGLDSRTAAILFHSKK